MELFAISARGHERRFREVSGTSALPPRATFELTLLDVSKVPTRDIAPFRTHSNGVVLIQELPAGCAALFAGRFPRTPGDDAARRLDHIFGIE